MPKVLNRSLSREERIAQIVRKRPGRLEKRVTIAPWEDFDEDCLPASFKNDILIIVLKFRSRQTFLLDW
jgi:hypothetical protein